MRLPLLLALALTLPGAAALATLTPAPVPLLAEDASPLAVFRAAAGTLVPVAAPDLAALPERSLREEVLVYYARNGAVPTAQGLARLDAGLAAMPAEVQGPVQRILAAMDAAAALRAEAFAGLTWAEVAWLHGASFRAESLPPEDAAAFLALAGRIDLAKMAAAGAVVLATLEQEVPRLRAAAALPGMDALSFIDPTGTLEVAGTAGDAHPQDRTLLLDLGGDDVWSNNAGAMAPTAVIELFPGCFTTGALDCTALYPRRNGPAIQSLVGRWCAVNLANPLFEGDAFTGQAMAALGTADPAAIAGFATAGPGDFADAALAAANPELGCVPQGADDLEPWAGDFVTKGALSDADAHFVNVGVDIAGNDVFAPPKSFNFMVDGRNPSGCDTRWMGEAGKLWDRNVTAGSSFAGVGVLWDEAGADFYGGRSMTQGVGHVGGAAALVDRGTGDDRYEGIRFAQGMAFAVGIGLLYDEAGDDRYEQKNLLPLWNEFEAFSGCDVSTRDGQGRSNILGVGALVDGAGDDVYYTQDHIADGLLLPGASRDDPTTTQGSTGARLNLGPSALHDLEALGRGLLWDRGNGADVYSRPGRGNGCASTGGSFLDEGASLLGSLGPCPSA